MKESDEQYPTDIYKLNDLMMKAGLMPIAVEVPVFTIRLSKIIKTPYHTILTLASLMEFN